MGFRLVLKSVTLNDLERHNNNTLTFGDVLLGNITFLFWMCNSLRRR